MAAMHADVLAIDDQEDNLALLEALLAPQNCVVRTALDGPTGLALAREQRPDLVLLDLAMPGMDGFEVLRRLREDPATRKVPVVVLTANHREAASVARGLELGATEYLTKPIQLDELVVRLRSALRLARAERELERLRDDFASMLVHDMRAPLDGVRLALATLARASNLSPPQHELVGLAMGSLAGLGELVENLLQVNRLEDEGFTPHRARVELAAVARASVAALGPVAAARGLALTAEGLEAPVWLDTDERLVARILDNLLSNALKFTDEGGVTLALAPAAGGVELGVADTGTGIPADALPHVFDRYYHLERRRERAEEGFGLGLAFCQRAAAALGGRISVESEPGRGSTFRVWLPAP